MKLSILAFSGLVLCGCAHLATVKTTEPHVPTLGPTDEKLAVATQHLTEAEHEQPLIALGNDMMTTARTSHAPFAPKSDPATVAAARFDEAKADNGTARANAKLMRTV